MKHRYQQPHPQLSEYVRTVLVVEGAGQAEETDKPLFTSGMPAILCRIERERGANERITELTLFGTSVHAEYWETGTHTTLIAYFFKPFTLSCLFNIPAAQLIKNPVKLGNWNAHKTNALRIQLSYADTVLRMIEALDNLLIQQDVQQRKECEVIQYATDKIMHNSDTHALPELINELGMNERTFQRMFKKYVGITPNQFRRICQFQLSFDQLRAGEFGRMTDVAYDNGFADQSHFIRSFREFTQTTPNTYLRHGLKPKKP